jgi:hypothetical protein
MTEEQLRIIQIVELNGGEVVLFPASTNVLHAVHKLVGQGAPQRAIRDIDIAEKIGVPCAVIISRAGCARAREMLDIGQALNLPRPGSFQE